MPMDELCFLWIFFCFLLSFWQGLPMAALFTLTADYFLLFTENYAAGLFFFLLVQITYLQNLRIQPFPIGTIFIFPLALLFPLPLLGICYALLFFLHINLAMKKAQPSCSKKLYLFGLFLFLCCDLTVAWGYFHTPNPRLIWLFYAPSQLLLTVTARVIPIR